MKNSGETGFFDENKKPTVAEGSSEHAALELELLQAETVFQAQPRGMEVKLNLTEKPHRKYEQVKAVGQGGMKSILKVRDRDTMRNLAMAVLPGKLDNDRTHWHRFVHEARITANLEHPNIVPIHDIGEEQSGSPYFTMKLLEGENLANIIIGLRDGNEKFRGRYDLPHLLQIFLKVCNAIDFCHSKGIIHLDIKPENIQVGDFGEVLVLDWGLAKIVGNEEDAADAIPGWFADLPVLDHGQTMDGEVKGTPGYMAPEQAAGRNQEKDERTDIYSLGAILYCILTWTKPISGKSVKKIVEDTVFGKLIHPSQRSPDKFIPNALEAVTLKAMAVEPEGRYQNVEALIKDIEAFTGGYATIAEKASWFRQLGLWIRRHKVETILATILTAVVITAAASWIIMAVKRNATWGKGRDITPHSIEQLNNKWLMAAGNWELHQGRLRAISGRGDSFRLFYHQPVHGNIALEFDALVETAEDLKTSGDLSIILSGNPDGTKGYFLQVGGLGNTSAIIQRRDGNWAAAKFSLKPGRKYHVRAEKEGEKLRLYCDGKLLLSMRDIFYLEGGFVGIYTFGKGKQFWNIQLHERGVPELVSPMVEGDSFYRASRATAGGLRKRYLRQAHGAYTKIYKNYPDREIGLKALLKRAYVSSDLDDLAAARKDAMTLAVKNYNWDLLLLRGELDFRENMFNSALSNYQEAFAEYPSERANTATILMGKLSQPQAAKISPEIRQQCWHLCAEQQMNQILRCRQKHLTSLDFVKGLDFVMIDCSGNQIRKLDSLVGLPLKRLDCADNQIGSLEPLRGMQLEELECHNNPITSLEALRGLPLKALSLNGCDQLYDLGPLQDCPSLEKLTIPNHLRNIDFLKDMPNLKFLNTDWDSWTKTAEEFWAEREN